MKDPVFGDDQETRVARLRELARHQQVDDGLLGDMLSEMTYEHCLEIPEDFDTGEQIGYLHRSGVHQQDLLAIIGSAGSDEARALLGNPILLGD